MISLNLKSTSLNDIIHEIAHHFGADVSVDGNFCELHLPEARGKGTITGISFYSGIGMMTFTCTFNEAIAFHFLGDGVPPLKFLFCLEGKVTTYFTQAETDQHCLNRYHNAIVSPELNNGHVLHFNKNILTEVFSIELNRQKLKSDLWTVTDIPSNLKSILADQHGKFRFYYDGVYSFTTAFQLQEILHNDQCGIIKTLFLEAKAYQIISSQLLRCKAESNDRFTHTFSYNSDAKSVQHAVKIITNELHELDTIQSIAKRVGLNTVKLQHAFKNLYGLTVNVYIQRARLNLAKELLATTNLPIQDIIYRTGWTSCSYFSKIFKDHFNQSPSDYRKAHMSEHLNTLKEKDLKYAL